jgi:dipeptidyl aminopeptidase/acylaminoacyl peptidase
MRPSIVVRALVFVAALLPIAPARAQGNAPAPDIFLVRVRSSRHAIELAGEVKNVTNRPGYDNQPSWSPDGRALYYTSTREDAQADIYRVDVASGESVRVTMTAPESEYSATVTPDKKAISVIRVERDSTQRLWSIPLTGGESHVILPTVKPAGYHAWADARTIGLFVLGQPNALVLADLKTGKVDTVARSIGRSLHRIPGTNHLSFVSKIDDEEWWIVELDPRARTMTRLARLPKDVEDYAWTPGGTIVAGDGSRLVRWTGTSWEPIGDLAASGLSGITRLSVSPRGDWIAVVAIPAAKPAP